MQRLLAKRALRNLKKNFPRYGALMALIILALFIVVSTIVASETALTASANVAEETHCEDGHFTTFVPLTDEEQDAITDEGVTLEALFNADYTLDDDSTLRIYKNREEIDLVHVIEGSLPAANDEIALERRYAEEHELAVGDTLKVAGESFTISAIAISSDYEGPFRSLSDSAVDSKAFGVGWVTDDAYDTLLATGASEHSEEFAYAFLLNDKMTADELKNHIQEFTFNPEDVTDTYFQEYWVTNTQEKDDIEEGLDEVSDGIGEVKDGSHELRSSLQTMGLAPFAAAAGDLEEGVDELQDGFAEFDSEARDTIDEFFEEADVDNLQSFVKADKNPRIGCIADDQSVNIYTGYLAGIIVLMLFAYVIAIFVVHEIERDSTIIGSLYALGVTRRDLLLHYLQVPVLVTFIGGLVGLLLGISQWSVDMTNAAVTSYYSCPEMPIVVSPLIIAYALLVPTLIAVVVNCFVISRKLKQPALSLIRNERKQHRAAGIKLTKLGFVGRFRIRQFFREFRGSLATVGGIFIAYLLLMMSINCYVLCNEISVRNTDDVEFSNMYLYKYPPAEVPDGGEEAYAETFQMETLGFTLDVTLMGIDEDNPYFEVESLPANGSDVVISDSVATKFGLDVGDTFVMEDSAAERNYAFKVSEIVSYSPSFFVFMDIDEMRDLMGAQDDYFNTVFADKDLDIPSGQLYSTLTAEGIQDAASVFLGLMESMISTMSTVSIIIFMVVMYLMMRVAVDRSSQSIALFRIFGYKPREIRKLFLDGNFFVVAIGAAIALPLSKIAMDALYPSLVFNVSCGIYLTFPWWYFAIIYVATLVLYMIISQFLMHRIKKISPAIVLKNRE